VKEETAPCQRVERRRIASNWSAGQKGGDDAIYLATRIRPAKERSARDGIHQGPVPLGYTRVVPSARAHGSERHPRALLAPDPVYAPIVGDIFARYAAGGWSHIRLVAWLNGDPRIPPPPGKDEWTCSTIQALLRNPLYCGLVRYNHRPEGRYDRAAPGSEFLASGRHAALINRATFDRVAERRATAFTRPGYQRHADTLGVGLFVCASCGGPMTPSHQEPGLFYRCSWYQRRKGSRGEAHTAMGYAGAIAEEALLREVRRLRLIPWTPQAEQRCTDIDWLAQEERSAAPCRAPAAGDDRPLEWLQTIDLPGEDPLRAQAATVANLRDLHARLTATETPVLIDHYLARGDDAGLRLLVRELVASARIVERLPERQPKWLRAEVTWQPEVRLLLEAGVARLAVPAPPPEQSVQAERRREAQRRYSARHRQEQISQPRA